MIEKGANVNAEDNYGKTPLLWASRNGHKGIVELLIDNGANIEARNEYGYTPLLLASYRGHIKIVKLLIDNGADLNAKDNYGWTTLILASRIGYIDIVKLLIDNGADIEAKNNYGYTPLLLASYRGNTEIVKLLIDKGANIEARNNDGWTPLHWASANGHIDIVKLLERGEKAHKIIANLLKFTKIEEEIEEEIEEKAKPKQTIVEKLFELVKGGEFNLLKKYIEAFDSNYLFDGEKSPKEQLSEEDRFIIKRIKQILVNRVLSDDVSICRNYLLYWAVFFQNSEMIGLLLDNGANINHKDGYGRTALFEAVNHFNYIDALRLLINNGANINLKDIDGNTALYVALIKDPREREYGRIKITYTMPDGECIDKGLCGEIKHEFDSDKVKLLIEKGTRIDLKNNQGNSVAWEILNSDNEEIRGFANLVTKENFKDESTWKEFKVIRDEKQNVENKNPSMKFKLMLCEEGILCVEIGG